VVKVTPWKVDNVLKYTFSGSISLWRLIITRQRCPKSRTLLILAGSRWDCTTFLFVDQNSTNFYRLTWEDWRWSFDVSIFDIWILSGDIRDQIPTLLEIARTVNFRRYKMRQQNFFVSGPKFSFFRLTWEELPLITSFPEMCDISIRYGYIRDQSLKLSEIAPNFGCFGPPNFRGAKQLYPNYRACLRQL